MSNKKGFTLVELLAVIVILAIILAIAVPGIASLIGGSTKSSFENDAKMILKSIFYKTASDSSFDPSDVNETNINSLLDINVNTNNYQTITVKVMNDEPHITVVGKGKWANLTVSGTRTETKADTTVTSFVNGANAPVLATGMRPIKWDTNGNWSYTTVSDTTWYNYTTTDKQWANAMTADGSMWVWIPRYVYKIKSGWHLVSTGEIEVQFSKGIDDNWNKA
ncbi:MAG: prepilin-type N-terminal cleavage/methylation domain-containing protein, partial [Bacilli bacterium]